MHTHHLVQALAAFGCAVDTFTVPTRHQMPARTWVRDNAALFAELQVIIIFSNHFGTLLGQQYQCNITGAPIRWGSEPLPHEEDAVLEYLVVRNVPLGTIADQGLADRRLLQRVRRLAAKHGVIITRHSEHSYLVTCPELEHDDPHEGNQIATSAEEAMSMVEDYVDCLLNGYLEAVTDPRVWDLYGSQWIHPATEELHAGAH
ncbi:hypothetical protein [Acidovorax sp.]|uniref:hypothetical protein n=1 Tax=Acidovorax sp. TaxID=1872122 RepID=UPI00391F6EF5